MPAPIDNTGLRFGRLVGVKRIGGQIWLWRCDCGSLIERPAASVRFGNTSSCGCFRKDDAVRRATTHGLSKTGDDRYRTWESMRKRCNNPNDTHYHRYGGRGIKVCDRWDDFALFAADMGPKPTPEHSIDRIDNNGNYCPENCRWASDDEQRANKEYHPKQKPLVIFGQQYSSINNAALELGVSTWSIYKLIRSGIAEFNNPGGRDGA